MISFHPLGNPLSYRGATMSWFGRQMRTYSKDGISANFRGSTGDGSMCCVGHYTLAIANSHLSKTATGNSNYGQAVTGFTEGKYYTFSAFVKTTNVSPIGVGGLEGG